MSDEQALLAAIWAHPHEDTPRLMYADWLQENGHTDRAEFIRVQCELARLDEWDERRPALEKRKNDDYLQLSSQGAHDFGRGTWNFFGKFEVCMFFDLAEIRRLEKLLQTDNLGALDGGGPDASHRLFQISLRLGGT